MFIFEEPGERVIAIMTAGSLSTTQTTIARLKEAIEDPERGARAVDHDCRHDAGRGRDRRHHAVGHDSTEIEARMPQQGPTTAASMIVAGQRRGGEMRMFLVYPEGNFIEATADTPFLQIGEHKYGKPILDRVVRPDTSLVDAKKAVLLSMDSTLRSNLSVGMPLDLAVIERDALRVTERAADSSRRTRPSRR